MHVLNTEINWEGPTEGKHVLNREINWEGPTDGMHVLNREIYFLFLLSIEIRTVQSLGRLSVLDSQQEQIDNKLYFSILIYNNRYLQQITGQKKHQFHLSIKKDR